MPRLWLGGGFSRQQTDNLMDTANNNKQQQQQLKTKRRRRRRRRRQDADVEGLAGGSKGGRELDFTQTGRQEGGGHIEDLLTATRKRKRAATRAGRAVKAKDNDVKAVKSVKEELGVDIKGPPNWQVMYETVKRMRERNPTAPVDTMGCSELYWRSSSPRDRRFHTLIALMLSSQTKDTVTAATMLRLHTQLTDETSDNAVAEVWDRDHQKTASTLTLENMLAVSPERLNELIRAVGFHNNKTRYIKATAEILRDQFDSDIPSTVEGLISLPGVGPKMAYLCMSSAWSKHEGIGVDVHVHRITNLWGWNKTKTPEATRAALESWLPRDKWHEINKLLVGLGQTVCLPVGRRCAECDLSGTGLCIAEIKSKSRGTKKRISPVKADKEEDVDFPEVRESKIDVRVDKEEDIALPDVKKDALLEAEDTKSNIKLSIQEDVEDMSKFAQIQQRLLLAEHEDEIASSPLSSSSAAASASTRRALQNAGHALTGMVLTNCRTGMGGREVGEFGLNTALSGSGRAKGASKDEDNTRLGVHGITVGDIVRVEEIASGKTTAKSKAGQDDEKGQRGLEGVVTRVGERSIWAAFGDRGKGKQDEDGVDELWGRKLWLMNQTMAKLEKMPESEHSQLIRVLFGHTTPSPLDFESVGTLEFMDASLNDSQKEAIRFALASREIALIHGPPGTGKTHTLIELIRQLVQRKKRVLVCGPSNISVDNIVERLALHKVPLVRIGHPARLLSSVLDHSLEVLSQTSEAAAIVKDVRKEIDSKQASIRKTRNGRERRAIYGDLKELRKEFRERESKCVDNIVSGSQVVLGTLHGAGGHQLKNQKFDVVLIDEASQAREAQCWIPLLPASRVVLAGDHLQLPPTIKSKSSSKSDQTNSALWDKEDLHFNELSNTFDMRNLEITLFDRLLSLHGTGIKRVLTTQYRMHQKIMDFPSDELYESKLIAADAVRERLLKDLPYEVEDTDDTREPLVFYDTQGGDFPEKSPDSNGISAKSLLVESKCNDMEAAVVARHVENLVSAGVRPEDIAVITPYNAQVALLSQLLKEKLPTLELGSVDGFQGREKEAVVVSLVRSNSDHEVGFLGEKRRLNEDICVFVETQKLLAGGFASNPN
ncbi:hypothetical protein TRV_07762 [Trichophyton verrucosum HKI 0517]|uniref:Endonuclease III homolog n=1 Tax=Trichophyton verrucosum (strain HKI 0517) TaxID=663202 RepID=D4DKP0_TRIVH|nr:uncharacterized protein TRV_07762 [Trichophyton verrucosum HKI 0517]EFE37584.1 hypothetical protein TRV_07762 [Trichophyton verrucosum HKI 0517]